MRRYLHDFIIKDLRRKCVLLSGPRQVGKTTLARSLFSTCEYLNYDIVADRRIIASQSWNRDTDLVILDELHKPYVTAARARGLDETVLTYEYPVQVALNPFISTLGWALPGLVNGGTIISVTLSLPTAGPLLLRALQSQDMYLAGAFILVLGTLTILGTLISDLLLAWIDPRIRLDR